MARKKKEQAVDLFDVHLKAAQAALSGDGGAGPDIQLSIAHSLLAIATLAPSGVLAALALDKLSNGLESVLTTDDDGQAAINVAGANVTYDEDDDEGGCMGDHDDEDDEDWPEDDGSSDPTV